MILVVVGCAAILLGCGGDESPLAAPTTSNPDATAPAASTDSDASPAEQAEPVVVSADGTTRDDETGDAEADTGSGAADLDAEPLPSDATGDVPAGPPTPDDSTPTGTDDETVPGGEDADASADTDDGEGAESDGGTTGTGDDPDDGSSDPSDPPGPTIDTDTSPDDGDVPNGVSGDTDVRENLSYPAGSVIALGRGATTDLASELAGSDQPTLLWFWTPDCPTCVPESASVARFAETYQGTIRVLGVGSGGSRSDADGFASSVAIDASLLVWEQGSVSHDHYNVTAAPFAIMVAPNGVVMAQWRGMVPELFAFADRL